MIRERLSVKDDEMVGQVPLMPKRPENSFFTTTPTRRLAINNATIRQDFGRFSKKRQGVRKVFDDVVHEKHIDRSRLKHPVDVFMIHPETFRSRSLHDRAEFVRNFRSDDRPWSTDMFEQFNP
jgi:hypothetical protein